MASSLGHTTIARMAQAARPKITPATWIIASTRHSDLLSSRSGTERPAYPTLPSGMLMTCERTGQADAG